VERVTGNAANRKSKIALLDRKQVIRKPSQELRTKNLTGFTGLTRFQSDRKSRRAIYFWDPKINGSSSILSIL
jgi:hypothetical protein